MGYRSTGYQTVGLMAVMGYRANRLKSGLVLVVCWPDSIVLLRHFSHLMLFVSYLLVTHVTVKCVLTDLFMYSFIYSSIH